MKRKITTLAVALASATLAIGTSTSVQLNASNYQHVKDVKKESTLRAENKSDFDDNWTNPNYAGKFKAGDIYYYVISKEDKLAGIAPCNGFNDMNEKGVNAKIPETISHNGTEYKIVSVGPNAFANRFDTNSLKLPKTIRYIGRNAFVGSAITEIEIPEETEVVERNAFYQMPKLEKISIGKKLTVVGDNFLVGCFNLKEITLDEASTIFSLQDGILYNKDKTTLIKCPPYRPKVKKVTLPASVKSIGRSAFSCCRSLEEIELNEGLKDIRPYAFYLCKKLKSLKIPASVESIEDGSAFSLLPMCEKFEVAEGNQFFTTMLEGKLLVQKTSNTAVSLLYTEKLDEVTLPKEIEHIGSGCFIVDLTGEQGNDNESIKGTFGDLGFQSIVLPEGLKGIGDFAFSGSNIGAIKIPDQVEKIGIGAFAGCHKLRFVKIGKGCKNIEKIAFSDCEQLASSKGVIRVLAETAPTISYKKDLKSFDEEIETYATLQVPNVETYKKAKGWKKFRSIISLEGQANQKVSVGEITLRTAQGVLYIETPVAKPLAIYSMTGALLYNTSETACRIELNPGAYLVVYEGNSYKVYIH